MKKRALILAAMLMTAQVFAAIPSFSEENTDAAAEELMTEDIEETASEEEVDPESTLEEDAEETELEEEEETSRPEYDFHNHLKKLGEYKELTAEVEPLEEVTDEMVQAEIDSRMKDITDEFTEGTVEEGDIANIDYVGKKDDVAFDGGTANGYDLEIGSHSFIDGFEDGLIGVKIGDTVDLNLTFPENYHSADLAGAEVVFTVTVNSVRRVAEFSDEAASQLSDGACKDMASYQESVKEELVNANKEAQMAEAQNDFWSQILEASDFDTMPEDVVAYDVQKQIDYDTNVLLFYYGTTLEDYCTSAGMTMEDYEAMVHENIENYLKYEIVEQAILEAEHVTFTEEDFNSYARTLAEQYDYELEDFLEIQEASAIWQSLYYDRASEIVLGSNTYIERSAE